MKFRLFAAAAASLVVASTAQAEGLFDNVSLGVGAQAVVGPKYEGSDEYQVRGFPLAFPVFNNGVSTERSRIAFRGLDDVRITVLRFENFDLGPVVGYSFGRDQDVSDKLGGLGDVDGGLVLGGFGSYHFGMAFVEAAISSQVTGGDDNGVIVSFGGGIEAPINSQLTLRSSVSAEYASNDYMDRYFSVTPAQSAASVSNYGVFDAGGGIKSIDFNNSLNFKATDRLTLRASVGYSRLVGDAADSPISESDNQFSGGLGFTYRF